MGDEMTPEPGVCEPRLNRNVLALSATSMLNDLHTHPVKSLLPAFMANVLGLSKSAIGVVEGVGEASAAATHWVPGWVSDRMRARKSLAAVLPENLIWTPGPHEAGLKPPAQRRSWSGRGPVMGLSNK